jgi:hypothetical protein
MAFLLLFWVSFAINADGGHHQGEPGVDGVDGVDGQDGIDGIDGIDGFNGMDIGLSESDFAQGLSLAFAMSGMDFTSTTTKLQVGFSGAWYDGENSVALGVAQVIDSDTFGDVLLSLKMGTANSHTAGVVSAVWKIQ